jgi:hypothetical protein
MFLSIIFGFSNKKGVGNITRSIYKAFFALDVVILCGRLAGGSKPLRE